LNCDIMLGKIVCGCWLALLGSGLAAEQLSINPATPTPLDLVRLRYTHVGCTNADSVTVAQSANRITVQADRVFLPDCGTINGYFEDFTLGRLPAGEYDAELIVNPPHGTLGPSVLIGPVHFTVAALPPPGSLHPHENYGDMWWNPQESGWALNVFQSGDKLIAVWAVYDAAGDATWYALLSGSWLRDASNVLHYAGTVYRTTGPYWGGAYDPAATTITAVGTADFLPTNTSHAQFSYAIQGITGSKAIERLHF
jgi:hypothetical protein